MSDMYIQLHDNIAEHPKTLKCSRDLGIPVPHVVGYLGCLWTWTLRMASDGEFSSFDIDDIELGAKWDGEPGLLVSTLIKHRFLDDVNGVLCVHDWDVYAESIKKRNQKRRERERQSGDSRATVGRQSTTVGECRAEQNRTEQRGTEQNREGISARDTDITKSESLQCAALDDPLDATYEHQKYVWQSVIADWVAISGLPHDAQTNREPAEAILRLAKSVTPNDPRKSVRKALKAWVADDWVRKNRPPITNLVKFFDRHVSDAPKPDEQTEPKEFERRAVYQRDTEKWDEKQKQDIARYEREGGGVPESMVDVVKKFKQKQLKNL